MKFVIKESPIREDAPLEEQMNQAFNVFYSGIQTNPADFKDQIETLRLRIRIFFSQAKKISEKISEVNDLFDAIDKIPVGTKYLPDKLKPLLQKAQEAISKSLS